MIRRRLENSSSESLPEIRPVVQAQKPKKKTLWSRSMRFFRRKPKKIDNRDKSIQGMCRGKTLRKNGSSIWELEIGLGGSKVHLVIECTNDSLLPPSAYKRTCTALTANSSSKSPYWPRNQVTLMLL